MRVLAYGVMPNQWHMVLGPREDGQLTAFLRWLTHTHTMRWHAQHHTAGTGHLYQGRFKAFLVQTDEHCLTVCRYVERNALRAQLVARAVAVVEFVATRAGSGGVSGAAERMAGRAAAALDRDGEPATERGRPTRGCGGLSRRVLPVALTDSRDAPYNQLNATLTWKDVNPVNQKHFEVELPDEILAGFGWQESEVPRRIREALVMELLRLDRLSEAEAARFLGLNRRELLETMGCHQVSAIQMSSEELQQELTGEIRRSDPS